MFAHCMPSWLRPPPEGPVNMEMKSSLAENEEPLVLLSRWLPVVGYSDFNPTVFTEMTRYLCAVPGAASLSTNSILASGMTGVSLYCKP